MFAIDVPSNWVGYHPTSDPKLFKGFIKNREVEQWCVADFGYYPLLDPAYKTKGQMTVLGFNIVQFVFLKEEHLTMFCLVWKDGDKWRNTLDE